MNSLIAEIRNLIRFTHQAVVCSFDFIQVSLPKDTNIHGKEHQLYVPGKKLLRRKLEEWGDEVEGKREVGE